MPEWLLLLLKFAGNDLPKILKRHLSRTIVTVAIATLALGWLIIGPWGSDRVRNVVLSAVLTNADDMNDVLTYFSGAAGYDKEITIAARGAGFYRKSDSGIVEQWKQDVATTDYSDDVRDHPSALQIARLQAARAQAPFQALGTRVSVSSPDCQNERPPYGFIYINTVRSDLRSWRSGQRVRLVGQDGRGEPVVAQIMEAPFKMPNDIQFHLNKVQYHMLMQTQPSAIVMINSTKSDISQVNDDYILTTKGINCPNNRSTY